MKRDTGNVLVIEFCMVDIFKLFYLGSPEDDFTENPEECTGGVFCTHCRIMIKADNDSNEEMLELSSFVSEHQHHGPVLFCYLNEDGDWVHTGELITRQDS